MYVSAESFADADKEEMGPEFFEVQKKVIEEINKLSLEKRFAMLAVLAIDTALILKYETGRIKTSEDLAYAFGTLWAGPLKKACTIAFHDHMRHFNEVKH